MEYYNQLCILFLFKFNFEKFNAHASTPPTTTHFLVNPPPIVHGHHNIRPQRVHYNRRPSASRARRTAHALLRERLHRSPSSRLHRNTLPNLTCPSHLHLLVWSSCSSSSFFQRSRPNHRARLCRRFRSSSPSCSFSP